MVSPFLVLSDQSVLQLFTDGLSYLFLVCGFTFIVIFCVSSLPLVWAGQTRTSSGLLLFNCLQIKGFSSYCFRRMLKLWKFIRSVRKRYLRENSVGWTFDFSLNLRGYLEGVWERENSERAQEQLVSGRRRTTNVWHYDWGASTLWCYD